MVALSDIKPYIPPVPLALLVVFDGFDALVVGKQL